MMNNAWISEHDALVNAAVDLGFSAELGDAVAKHLGSPKAMRRMIAYLTYVRPNRAEDIADEMLAICAEINTWKEKKDCQRASSQVNAMLWYGLGEE